MTDTTNATIEAFAQKVERFKAEHQGQIANLAALIENHLDAVDEFLDDNADYVKSYLAAKAANDVGDDEDAQEAVLCAAEAWVTDNISNSTLENRVAAVLWMSGPSAGEEALRKHLPTSETATVRLTMAVTGALNHKPFGQPASTIG